MLFYAKKLTEIRKQKKISMTQFAKIAGLNRTTLWTWENERVIPSEKKIRHLAKILDISVELISDLAPVIPVSETVDSSQVNALLYSFENSKTSERRKRQKYYLKTIEAQFDEFNQIVSVIETFLNSIQTIFYAKDASLKYIVANQAFLNNVSLGSDYKILGCKDEDFFPNKEAKFNAEEDSQVILTGESLKHEGYIPGSRKKRWGIISKVPIFDFEGKIAGVLGYFTDITKRKKAELLVEEFKKGMGMLDETIWMAKNAKECPVDGVVFEEFLYAIDNKFIKKLKADDNMSLKEIWDLAYSFTLDNDTREKFSIESLKKTGFTEIKFRLKFPDEDFTTRFSIKVYSVPDSDSYVGVIREDIITDRIERIAEKLRKSGVDEAIIKAAVAE